METLTKLFETRLDAFLERTGPGPSTFGLQATGDPNSIRQLRLGRSPTLATGDRILAFMDACTEAHEGPVSIPWLLFEPLSFLFWGWFRTLMVYTLYGVVAGTVLRVFMGVGMGYVTTYTGALTGTGSSDPADLGLWVVLLLPLVVSGLMAGLKVGELAPTLVSGSGSGGSGLMALVIRSGGRFAAPSPARPPVPGGRR